MIKSHNLLIVSEIIMKSYSRVLVFSAVFGLAASSFAADIKGKVSLKGEPKAEISIKLDVLCGKLHEDGISTRHYVVGKDHGLANTLVYIKSGVGDKKFDVPSTKPVLDQVGCEYEPYVTAVMVGQELQIRNSDPLMHNVHATPTKNKGFNFAQVIKGQTNNKKFTEPEVMVRFKCDVHPWMFAYVGVLENPYFAITDKDGNFSIKNVPAGKYTLEAYHVKAHRKAEAPTQDVTVGSDTVAVSFTVEAQ